MDIFITPLEASGKAGAQYGFCSAALKKMKTMLCFFYIRVKELLLALHVRLSLSKPFSIQCMYTVYNIVQQAYFFPWGVFLPTDDPNET